MLEPGETGPSRSQKRWSGRLRTAGALLGLLGAVATADRLLGLARDDDAVTVLTPTRPGSAPLPLGLGTLALGGALYALGRRWGPR